jgi:hypothetical protein
MTNQQSEPTTAPSVVDVAFHAGRFLVTRPLDTRGRGPPWLDFLPSPGGTTTNGVSMQLVEVLDVVEALFRVSEHPDIANIERYGRDTAPGGNSPAGVKVTYGTGSSGLLFGASVRDEIRVAAPDALPHFKQRAPYTAILALRLLDVAKPERFTAWHLVALPAIGHDKDQVSGLRIECSDGTSTQLRALGMGSQIPEPDVDPALDYRVPEGVTAWQQVNAASAGKP